MKSEIIKRAMSLFLVAVIISSYSMVALAGGDAIGEITVIGGRSGDSAVSVNGEPARSGRTLFAGNTITTPDNLGAIVSLGSGRVELAPNTTFILGEGIGGELSAGSVTVLEASGAVGIETIAGDAVLVKAGETAVAGLARAAVDYRDKTTGKCIDDDNDGKEECSEGLPLWALLVIGGAIVGTVTYGIVATRDDDDDIVASPIR